METTTQVLHIALQDGFDDEPVIVRVGGAEVLRREDVRTDPRIGVAYAFDVPMPQGGATVDVELPRRGVLGSTRLESGAASHLGVSVRNGAVHFRASPAPFGYV